jgi:hypothetical protein
MKIFLIVFSLIIGLVSTGDTPDKSVRGYGLDPGERWVIRFAPNTNFTPAEGWVEIPIRKKTEIIKYGKQTKSTAGSPGAC